MEKQLKAKESALTKAKIQRVNKQSNQPSSNQAEWEQKGVGNDGEKSENVGKKEGKE
ncbi:MAG: hypothetical protein AAF599_10360 [Bacteroidota bacterium]